MRKNQDNKLNDKKGTKPLSKNIKKILITIAVLGGVGFFLNIAIDNPWSHSAIRNYANQYFAKERGWGIQFQAIEVTILPPGASIYGISIFEKDTQRNILKASQISWEVSIFALLLGEFKLSYLSTIELQFEHTFIMGSETEGNGSDQKDPEISWPPEVPLPISELNLQNSAISLKVLWPDSPKNNLIIDTAGVDLNLEIDSWEDMSGEILSSSFALNFLDAQILETSKLTSEIQLKGNEISLKNLHLTSKDINFTAGANLIFKTKKIQYSHLKAKKLSDTILQSIDIESKSNVYKGDMSILGRFLDIADTSGPFTGDVHVQAKVPFIGDTDTSWQVETEVKTENARIFGFTPGDTNLNLDIDKNKISFNKLEIWEDSKKVVSANGAIHLNESLTFSFSPKFSGIRLKDFLEIVKVKDFDVLDGDLFSGDLNLDGMGFPFRLEAKGKSYIVDITSPVAEFSRSRFIAPPDCILNLDIFVDSQKLDYGKSSLSCFETADNQPIPEWQVDSQLLERANNIAKINFRGHSSFSNDEGMNLILSGSSFEVSSFKYFADAPIEGLFDFESIIKGPYSNIQVSLNARSENATLGAFPMGATKIQMHSNINSNTLIFPEISARTLTEGEINITNGKIFLNKSKDFEATIKGKGLNTGFISQGLAYWAKGKNVSLSIDDFSGKLSGPIQYPLQYQGYASFKLSQGTIGEESLFSKLNGKLNLNDEKVTANDIQFLLGSSNSSISLEYKKNKSWSPPKNPDWLEQIGGDWQNYLKVEIEPNKDPERLQNDLAMIPYIGKDLEKSSLSGHLKVQGSFEGPIKKPNGKFNIQLLNPKFLGSDISPISAQMILTNNEIDVYQINQSGNSLLGRFKVDYTKDELPYSMYFALKNFDIRSLGTNFFYSDPRNYAYLDGDIELSGELRKFWSSKGQASINKSRIKLVRDQSIHWNTYSLETADPIKLNMDTRGWNIEDDKILVLKGDLGKFQISTNGNQPPEQLSILITSEINADILKSFIPRVDSSKGFLKLEAKVSGSTSDPSIEITITDKKIDPFSASKWTPLSLNFTDYPPTIDNIRIKLSIQNGKVSIKEFTADKGNQGKIEALGTLDLSQKFDRNSAIGITTNNIDIRRFPIAFLNFDTEISSELQLSGNSFPLKLSGNVTVDKAQSSGDFDIRNQILDSIYRKKITSGNVTQTSLLKLDLAVQSQNIKIRNRNIIGSLAADLRILGTENRPLILGTVDILDGKLFYKRDFRVRRGIIKFQGATYPPDPNLDIMADAAVSQYTIQIAITGYASRKKVELTIDPPTRSDGTTISKVEILILLNQGRLPETNAQAGKFGDLAKVEAFNLAISQFEQPLEKLFDISGQTIFRQVYLDTVAEDDGKIEPRLNLPLHLTDDVNLIFQVVRNDWKLTSEYSVHDSILVTGSLENKKENDKDTKETEADTGVDLKFRFSFP